MIEIKGNKLFFEQTREWGAQGTALQRHVMPGMSNANEGVLVSVQALGAERSVKE